MKTQTLEQEIDEDFEEEKRLFKKCAENRKNRVKFELEDRKDRNDLLLARGRLTSRLNDLI
jgi:hypothetical protein